MPRATAISISQFHILFSVKYLELSFSGKKNTPTRHAFFSLFSNLFFFPFYGARNFTFGRTSPANILMKKHHPITLKLFDHMPFQRLFIYSQSTLLPYHHIKVLLREKRELEGIPEVILHKESR